MTRRDASPPRAVALDLGSTSIKAGVLDARGRLVGLRHCPTPPLTGEPPLCEGDAVAYAEAAGRLLEEVARDLPRRTPLGIASQRSTFVLWNRRSGVPARPLVSWQDRRAAEWCRRNGALAAEVRQRTGLVLSAHYAGPKLAALREADPAAKRTLDDPETLFGTLETWVTWLWSDGRLHETDPTMAARTSMADLAQSGWCEELLAAFGVPRRILPNVRPTIGAGIDLPNGLRLNATIADQAAGALALLEDCTDAAMVNLGTGAFVLRGTADPGERRPGYLTAPIHADAAGARRFALEGAINAGGVAVDRFGAGPTELPRADPSPGALCVPDAAGLGAPYWRPDLGLLFSDEAAALGDPDKRRIVLEGLLFRVREVLEELRPDRVLLAGGLAREPFVGRGLATLLDRPVEILEAHEAVLTGAARLAAGLRPHASPATRRVEPGKSGGYLRSKYERWRRWLASRLSVPA